MTRFSSHFRLILSIAAILVFAAMLRLGIWQLDRGAEKQAISDAVSTMSQTSIKLESQEITLDHQYARANVTGEYIGDETFLLDLQVSNGQVGYHVITPFKVDNSEIVVLVNRGWVPVGKSRSIKPEIKTPDGKLSITGRLNLPPSKPVVWDEDIPIVQNGAWQFLDLGDYSHRTGLNVASLLIELDKTLDQAGGYVRQWRRYDNHWVSRHRAYAFQWFSMAVVFLILCLYLWFRSKGVQDSRGVKNNV